MTLARLLIGSGGVFTPPAPPVVSPYTLISAPDGAVNPWNTPGSYSANGYTVLTWVDRTGNVKVGVFEEATKILIGVYNVAPGFEADAHTTPTICLRASDDKLILVYCLHNGGNIFVKVSNAAAPTGDFTGGFTSATNLDSQLAGTRYTDVQLHEAGGNLYLFYRDEPSAGTDSRWCISKTSAATPTSGWATQTIVYRVASKRSYVISALDAANGLIHFIATDGSPFTKLGHFYLDTSDDSWHKSDGSSATLPLAFTGITQAYGPGTAVFASNVVIDGSGNPYAAMQDDGDYGVLFFDGSSWDSQIVGNGMPGYEYSGSGTGFGAWGLCLDDGDVFTIYTIESDGGQPEVFSHTTADGWATFDTVQITTGTTVAQHQLICIRNPSPELRAYWDFGTWTSYVNYNVGLKGLGF